MNLYITTTGNDEGGIRTLFRGTDEAKATAAADNHELGSYEWLLITKYTLRNGEFVDPTPVFDRDSFPVSARM